MGTGQSGHATAQCQDLLQSGTRLDFINGTEINRASQRNARASWGDHDDVAWLQCGIFRFIALTDEIVQIQRGNGFATAFELDASHAAVGSGAAACKDSIDQGRQAAEVVGPGLLGLTHHIDGDATQFAQAGVHSDIVEHSGHLLAQGGFKVFHLDTTQVECANFGQIDLAVAVNGLAVRVVHCTPNLNAHFIALAQHILSWRRGCSIGHIGLGVVKQLYTKVGQKAPCALLHKTLKLTGLLGLACTKLLGRLTKGVCGSLVGAQRQARLY